MGKFDRYEKFAQTQQTDHEGVHPVWRGIGCLMIILIPIIAFAAADTFFDNASELSLFGSTVFPNTGIMYHVFFSIDIFGDTTLRLTFFHLVFTVLFCVVGYMILSFIYAVIYRFTGPPKYGPTDSPPLRRTKSKKRK